LLSIYNVVFHPLAKFPGPWLAAVCQVPYTRAALKGKHYLWVKKLHDYYASDVVRISPDELSFISPSAWTDITGARAGRHPFEQDERVHGEPPNPDRAVSMLTAKLSDHSRMRRVLDHAFSIKAFQEQQPVLEAYVSKLINKLREQVNSPTQGDVDLVKWFNWMTFDIIGDFSFGESFNCLENQDNHPWLDTVFGNLKVITFIGLTRRFYIFRKMLPYLIPKRAKEQTKIHFAYLDEKITKRIELGTDRPDFITPMLKHNVKGKGMTPAEIRANMGLMIVAGSESVVTVTCGAIYYMLKNPATMQRLNDEVRGTFKSEADIHSKSVLQLKYLTAVINESLRLYPSTPGLPACRVPPEGSTVSGHWIAGNVSALCGYPFLSVHVSVIVYCPVHPNSSPCMISGRPLITSRHRPASPSLNTPHSAPPRTSKTPNPSSPSAGSVIRASPPTGATSSTLSLLGHAAVSARQWVIWRSG